MRGKSLLRATPFRSVITERGIWVDHAPMSGGRSRLQLDPVDVESVSAEISAAWVTAETNRAKITESREVLSQAGETIERIRRRHSGL